ncbi:MAG TPA: PAS domain S-box protein [Dehalococcoidia bacterium]|nr:PAS domain S-box protein [Dehalococcoidia bacterium]
MDNARLHQETAQAQAEWEESFNGIALGVCIMDTGGTLLRANNTLRQWLGDRPLVGSKCYEAFQGQSHFCDGCTWQQSVVTGKPTEFEGPNPVVGGRFRCWLHPVVEDGKVSRMINYMEDVTERRQAEEALRQSEERYRTLFQESRDAIYITTREGKFVDVNQSALDLFGYTRQEMVGLDACQIYANPADRARFQQEIEQKGSVRDYEVKLRKKDGTERDCLLTATVRRANDGSILGYQGIIRDITERKRAGEALRKSEEEFRLAFENANDSIFWADPNTGLITNCNKAAEALLEKRRGEIIGHPQTMLHPPEKAEYYAELFKKHVELKGAIDEEAEVITGSGKIKPVHIISSVALVGGKPIIQEIFRDASERRQAQQQLKESEERYRALVEAGGHMGEAIVLLQDTDDVETAHLFVNEEWTRITGYTREELKGISYLDLIHPRYRDAVADRVRRRLRGEDVPGRFQISIVAKDGGEVPVEATGTPISYQGKPAIVGYIRDTSERKRTEEQLKESEERYRAMVELGAQVGEAIILAQDNEEGLPIHIFVNEEWCRITGYAREELIGMPFHDLVHPRDRDASRQRHRRKMRGESVPGLYEMTIVRKDGTEVLVELTGAYTIYQGKPAEAAYIRDITERKRAEAEMQQLNEALRRSLTQTVEALAAAVDAKDPYTHGHSRKVTDYAVAIGQEMGLAPQELEELRLAGILHDVGKIAVPVEVLARPRRLTPQEYGLVKTHVEASSRILEGVDLPQAVKQAVVQHHERYDGTGYPAGLSGQQISLGGRILAVADALEAMGADRPYRKALGLFPILRELSSCSGSQFDPEVAAAAIRVLRRGSPEGEHREKEPEPKWRNRATDDWA